jgi:hypothetical protein
MEDVITLENEVAEDTPIKEERYSVDEVLDMVEATILSRPQIQLKAKHTFTKGLYCRELFMPAGTEVISKCHNTQHQWVSLLGIVLVFTKHTGWKLVTSPERGITEPDTRRVLRTVTDCVWLTFHPTDHFPKDDSEEEILKAVALVEEDIILKRVNPLIDSSEVREIA